MAPNGFVEFLAVYLEGTGSGSRVGSLLLFSLFTSYAKIFILKLIAAVVKF